MADQESQETNNPQEMQNQSSASSTNTNSVENVNNLPSVMVNVSEEPDVKEPSLPMIGFYLSKFVLWIISGFIVLLVLYLFVKQFDASNEIKISSLDLASPNYDKKIQAFKLLQEEKKNYRDFILQISQMILLNLLLPVLTAILGYIFGSNKTKEE